MKREDRGGAIDGVEPPEQKIRPQRKVVSMKRSFCQLETSGLQGVVGVSHMRIETERWAVL